MRLSKLKIPVGGGPAAVSAWLDEQVAGGVPRGVLYLSLMGSYSESRDLAEIEAMSDYEGRLGNLLVGRNTDGLEAERQGDLDRAIQLYEANVTDRFDASVPYEHLWRIYSDQGQFDEAARVCKIYIRDIGVDSELCRSFRYWLQNLPSLELEVRIIDKLDAGLIDDARRLVDELALRDRDYQAEVFKWAGLSFLERGAEPDALHFLQAALSANPLLPGVKDKLKRLSRKLGKPVVLEEDRALALLENEERRPTDDWKHRYNLAVQYVKLDKHDKAWSLFNDALLLCIKRHFPPDKIYIQMGKLLEQEHRYKHALLHYVLAYRESRRFGSSEPSKALSRSVGRCLRHMHLEKLEPLAVLDVARTQTNTDALRSALESLVGGQSA